MAGPAATRQPLGDPSAEPTSSVSRGRLLRHGLVAGAVLAGGGVVAGLGASAGAPSPSAAQDRKIFNFALLLEYLQAAFYAEAVKHGSLRGEVRDFAEVVAQHEQAHVDYLRKALGSTARPRPAFTFGQATRHERSFLKAAILLENTGVAAYNGQAANLTKNSLAAAAEIVSVEGRHAAWISDLAGQSPAPRAADPGWSADRVVQTLKQTGFLGAS